MKEKRIFHSVKAALNRAKYLGYKYCDIPHNDMNVGDVIEIGLNRYRVEEIKIGFGTSEVRYSLIGAYHRTDDEYWHNVQATEQEKWEKSKEYYQEWLNNNTNEVERKI